MRYEFATPEPPRLRLGIAAGRVQIDTADTTETIVEVEAIRGDIEAVRVEQHGREIVIEHRKRFGLAHGDEYEIRVAAPNGTDADLNVASAHVEALGRLGTVEVNSASGDVEIEHAGGSVRVRAASGDVRVASVDGRANVNTASGDVELGRVGGEVTARSASGAVHVAEAAAGIRINTASGDQVIDSVVAGKVELKSASGDCRVGIKQGSRLYVNARSMSGETSSELELAGAQTESEGPLVELKAATMSGDIRVVRAP
jgi:DUF4097 and DUF4098 domain-containing protein YvlB